MRIHIIGLAGSGKTTLARRLGAEFGAEAHDLDVVVYAPAGGERPEMERAALLAEIAHGGWITEGAYHEAWLRPMLEAADAIVWLDVPFPICAWRIVTRHIRAELSRDNRHPGWRKLWRFLSYNRRTAGHQRTETHALLAPQAAKTVRCASPADRRHLHERLRAIRDGAPHA